MKILSRILLIAIVLANISVALLPNNVYAATDTLTVDGEGSLTQGTYVGGAGNFTNIQSNDDGTSYLRMFMASLATGYHTWSVTNTVATGTVNSVTMTARVQQTNNYSAIGVRIGGTFYTGTSTSVTSGWVTLSKTWTTSPATGSAWTTTEINNAEFGMVTVDSENAGSVGDISYLTVTVTYTPPTAPTVTTSTPTSVVDDAATLNGNITSNGGATITNRGFVWDTVSRANPGNVAPAASAYANNWAEGVGTYSTGTFSRDTGAVLVADTTYYVRAAALNSVSWTYGDEVIFKTVGIPTATTDAATNIGTTDARINATVTDDNGQSCDVRFGWGLTSEAVVLDYDTQTAWVENTYSSGSKPYVDISGLAAGTTYYFRVEVRNDAGSDEGAERSFTTPLGIDEPSSIIAIPYSDSISLLWVKGDGSQYTLIRSSTGAYPTDTAIGTLRYLGVNNSLLVEGLETGTTYYFSAWGMTGGVYSLAYETVMATTLAPGYEPIELEDSPVNASYTADASTLKVSQIPFWGAWVDNLNDAYGMQLNVMWYFIWLVFCAFAGIIIYNVTTKNLQIALFSELLLCGLGIVLGLVMLWVLVLAIIIVLGFILYGDRR